MKTTNKYLEGKTKEHIRDMVNKIGPGAKLVALLVGGDKRRIIFDKSDMVDALYKIAKLK